MPLTSINEPGEVDAFGVRFSMEQRGDRVRCHVFRSAVMALSDRLMVDDAGLLALFQMHRAMFEQLAANLFDAGHWTPWIEIVVSHE